MNPAHNKPGIESIEYKPDMSICYLSIPDVMNFLFTGDWDKDHRPLVNEKFDEKDFTIKCFSMDEIDTINTFKAFKKQIEWISGRYLIKNMIKKLFLESTPLDIIRIDYHEQGAPFVFGYPEISFSLSHSHDYTIAACSKNYDQVMGIDIEKIRKKPDPGFLKTAFTTKEIENLQDNALDIFRHWTIKEAYLKYIKKGFHESLHKVEIINNKIFHHGKPADLDIFSTIIEKKYISALVCDKA